MRVFLILLGICVIAACAKKEFYREHVVIGNDGKSYKIVETNSAEMRENTPQGPEWVSNLRMQLSRCWSIEAGAKYAEITPIEVRLQLSRKREVLSATIVDQWRYRQDSNYRKAADSALRVFKHPECKKLKVEPHKYETWKDMVVTFDPREML